MAHEHLTPWTAAAVADDDGRTAGLATICHRGWAYVHAWGGLSDPEAIRPGRGKTVHALPASWLLVNLNRYCRPSVEEEAYQQTHGMMKNFRLLPQYVRIVWQ